MNKRVFSWFGITPSEIGAFVMSVMIMLSLMWSDSKGPRLQVLAVLAMITSTSLTHVTSNTTIGVRNRSVSRSGVWRWLCTCAAAWYECA